MSDQTLTRCVVTVTAPAGSRRADVRIAGEVDVSAVPVLADAVRRLSETAPRSVFVDLGAVTFAGSVLPDFLKQVHDRIPRNSSLVVCRVSAASRRVIAEAGLPDVLVLCDDRLS